MRRVEAHDLQRRLCEIAARRLRSTSAALEGLSLSRRRAQPAAEQKPDPGGHKDSESREGKVKRVFTNVRPALLHL